MSKVRATLILYKELGMSKLDEEGLMDQMEEFPWLDKSCALSRVLAELQIFSWVMVRRRLDNLCWRCRVGWSSWVRSVELMVSVMAGLMLDRRLVMRYAARGRGKVACLGGGLDKGC
jgi:hypothetical protein